MSPGLAEIAVALKSDKPQQQLETVKTAEEPVPEASAEPVSTLRSLRTQAEIKAIQLALKHTRWNRKQAARLLKISYRGLLYKIRAHNITCS